MKAVSEETLFALQSLILLLQKLRKECPWDREQTMQSLTQYSVEEIYELCEAIREKNVDNIREELGDLLEHIFFYAMLAEEENLFTLREIAEKAHRKLVDRHPHIFANHPKLNTTAEVLENWQKIKKKEGKKYLLQGIPLAIPAISKAMRFQHKAAQVKFDFTNAEDAWEKVCEEIQELQIAVKENTNKEEELGDLLFAIVNYARHIDVDGETALQKANQKFSDRFTQMEKIAEQNHKNIADYSFEERNKLWEAAKKYLKNKQ